MHTFVNKRLRQILGIFWPYIITNEELLALKIWTGRCSKMKRRKWKWIGHTLRKVKENTSWVAMKWNSQGKRKWRPKLSWWRTVIKELERHREDMGWGREDCDEQSPVEGFCWGPMPHEGQRGLSQVSKVSLESKALDASRSFRLLVHCLFTCFVEMNLTYRYDEKYLAYFMLFNAKHHGMRFLMDVRWRSQSPSLEVLIIASRISTKSR